jgi:hypothetical protein
MKPFHAESCFSLQCLGQHRSAGHAKVVRCALQDAASVAGLLITTEAMVAELPKMRSGAVL